MPIPEPIQHLVDCRPCAVSTASPARSTPIRESLTLELSFSRVTHQPQQALPHVLFSPMHYEPGYAYPLIVWLHGSGCDERQVMRVMPMISMRNYVAVAPRGLENDAPVPLAHEPGRETASRLRYAWPQHSAAIEQAERRVFECIDIAMQRCNIARDRVFLAGFDEGGTMALRLAMLYPQSFGGVVSLCGSFPQGNLPLRQWNAVRSLPTLLAVGERSETFTLREASRTLALYHTAGMPISIRQYPCGQEIAPPMLEDLNRWIMERVCC
ncbi:MAG TPA: hypothetical protein DEB39_13890 [Planctomycetaceae bacterium]|nr:hypothetical protein [Planctomycetaceae bacterium]